jgi:transcription antitermination factor NusG
MSWMVIRSATRQEKRAASSLAELGFEVYLPLEARWVRHARQKTRATYPLFPGYLFARLSREDVWKALEADGVHNILGLERNTATVEPVLIEALRDEEISGAFDQTLKDPAKKAFKVGQQARVTSGQYSGFIGQVVQNRGKNRVLLLVSLFGRPQKIERPLSELEAA